MHVAEPEDTIETAAPRIFNTTRWSLVRSAGEEGSDASLCARETLCAAYWKPIYAHVRRKGHGPDDAEDLTQEFFSQVLAKNHLRLADHNKGRFRSFLLAMLDYFLAREWRRAHRQKRGGQYRFLSLDQPMLDEETPHEVPDAHTPERQFQRQWALTLLKQAMTALREECEADGKGELYGQVKHLLSGDRDGECYRTMAGRLGMTENALRVAVHRLRQRYGALLRAEISQTVGSIEEVEEELRHLFRVLSS
ncbi:MAG TPA: sigma-70 family RNA polymerase sigma factor [Verrucomicrobiae bacterium]|nr:sigma-70 family RNA polymerase sigma factor [Verrucomicrobiae bacterium]